MEIQEEFISGFFAGHATGHKPCAANMKNRKERRI